MHKPEFVEENEAHKILGVFKIQMNHLISARRPDQMIIIKIVNFAVLANHRVKWKESEKRDKFLDLATELKTMKHESDGDTNCN